MTITELEIKDRYYEFLISEPEPIRKFEGLSSEDVRKEIDKRYREIVENHIITYCPEAVKEGFEIINCEMRSCAIFVKIKINKLSHFSPKGDSEK